MAVVRWRHRGIRQVLIRARRIRYSVDRLTIAAQCQNVGCLRCTHKWFCLQVSLKQMIAFDMKHDHFPFVAQHAVRQRASA